MIINRPIFVPLAVAAAIALSGCNAVNEHMAYRDQQRRDCAAGGGYFEENKIGAPDNYTCEGLPGGTDGHCRRSAVDQLPYPDRHG